MEHERYGLDGMPIACRSADSDPVTGLRFPKIPKPSTAGIPYLRAGLAAMMVVFFVFFVWQSKLLG